MLLGEGIDESKQEEEFLVIASKFEILKSKVFRFERGAKGRILLYAAIAIDGGHRVVDVFHTHFGLNAPDHCVNVMDVLEIVNGFYRMHPDRVQILLGDFNTYLDWEYPMDILTVHRGKGHNHLLMELLSSKCEILRNQSNDTVNWNEGLIEYEPFKDVWKERYGKEVDVMRTFSNFEDERIEDPTVTDRILWRNGNGVGVDTWDVCDVWIAGDQTFKPQDGQDKIGEVYPSDHRTVITKMVVT